MTERASPCIPRTTNWTHRRRPTQYRKYKIKVTIEILTACVVVYIFELFWSGWLNASEKNLAIATTSSPPAACVTWDEQEIVGLKTGPMRILEDGSFLAKWTECDRNCISRNSSQFLLRFVNYAFQWSSANFTNFITRTWLRDYRKSICRLSVCNVRAPYSTYGVELFDDISSPLCTFAILWPTYKILRRSSEENPSVGRVKRKRCSK